jgi:hypothetical protein
MEDSAKNQRIPPLYSPSWVDRLNDWVAKWPGPVWAYYLVLWLVLFGVQTTVSWIEGAVSIGSFITAQMYLAGAISFMLALFYYLDARADKALQSLEPVLTLSEQEYHEYQFQLTNLPSSRAILSGAALVLLTIISELFGEPYRLELFDAYPTSATLLKILYFAGWFALGNFIYHTIHHLGLINRIYTRHTRINLFNLSQLYAFSNLSAITAATLAILAYGWMVVNPEISRSDPLVLAWMLGITLFALATFFWPQLGIHRIQVQEKERLLQESNRLYQQVTTDLHQMIDENELAEIGNINVAIATLEMEQATLKKIATWPWDPESLRLLVTALAFPLGIWLLQYILQSLLGS